MRIRDFVTEELPAALIARYRAALTTSGADVGAARVAVENEFAERQREERAEMRDFLDSIKETPGAPRGRRSSNYGTRKGAWRLHE